MFQFEMYKDREPWQIDADMVTMEVSNGASAGRSCVLRLNTWDDTKVLDMYNGLGGSIVVRTRMTFAFYVMQ